jgi:GT2 family glycosyltransferase
MSVGIVIVNWNGWRDTLECLASLYRMSEQGFSIMVVDNGSTNESRAEIAKGFPEVHLHSMGYNSGFSTANNVGIRHFLALGADFVWLLNNDTVVDAQALTQLLESAKITGVGIVGAVLFEAHQPDLVQAWGGGLLNPDLATTSLFKTRSFQPLEQIIGASMFFPVEVLRRIGLLHEAFFFYLEDTEISYRARRAGYRLLVSEDCHIWHKGGASVNAGESDRSELSDRYFAQANGVFLGLHCGWRSFVYVPIRLIGIVVRRVQRNQVLRIPMVVTAFTAGFLRGLAFARKKLV